MANINILDCTFRDGGYYNNWDFPADVVQNYLECMSEAHIDYIEILRFLELGISAKMLAMSNKSIPVDIPNELKKVENALRDIKANKDF